MKTNWSSLRFAGIILLVMAFVFGSCSLIRDDSPLKGTGKVAVYITDAPFPASLVEEVWITVDRIELRIRGGECQTEEGDPVGSSGENEGNGNQYREFECDKGFLLVLDEPVDIDLLQLRNGITELLAEVELPAGKYDMIRLYVTDALIVVDNNKSFPLKVPGGAESGLKIFLSEPLEVTEGGTAELLLDVDLSRSFVALGNPKSKNGIIGFIFKPVIRAVKFSTAGSIKGKVVGPDNQPVANALVSVIQGEEVVTTALTEQNGEFRIIGLPAGKYNLTVEAEGFKKEVIQNIEVKKKLEVLRNIKLTVE